MIFNFIFIKGSDASIYLKTDGLDIGDEFANFFISFHKNTPQPAEIIVSGHTKLSNAKLASGK